LGGELAAGTPYYVYLDDVSLYDPRFVKPVEYVLPQPDVRVNQVGYLPFAKKYATVVSSSTSPLKWQLLNSANQVVWKVIQYQKDLTKIHRIMYIG